MAERAPHGSGRGSSSLVNFASASPALATRCARSRDLPDGKIWFALIGFGGAMGGIVRTRRTRTTAYWTGGTRRRREQLAALVWSVRASRCSRSRRRLHRVGDADNGSSSSPSTPARSSGRSTSSPTRRQHARHARSRERGRLGPALDERFVRFEGSNAVFSLDYRPPDGTWVTPRSLHRTGNPRLGVPRLRRSASAPRRRQRADLAFQWILLARPRRLAERGLHVRPGDGCGGNVWASGTGGAARRDFATGVWQRYRITNTSQYDG